MIDIQNEEIIKYINDNKKLRTYQSEAVSNVINIFNNEVHNRFAAVVLPTGSGKSFVAMTLLQVINNPNFTADGYDVNNSRNNSNMLYVAPTKDILLQIKIHIVKNIFLPSIQNSKGSPYKGMTEDDILADPEIVNAIVYKVFPNLKLKCYAGIKGLIDLNDKDILTEKDVENAELIIFDEAHRAGAEDWSKKIETVISKNNAKILAISATPERNDKEGMEMMAGLAKMVYPDEVVTPDKYMAQEIYVLDAMRDGIINSPKVISSNFYLYYSDEYQDVLTRWRKEENTKTKETLGNIIDEMESMMGISSKEYENRQIPEEEIKQKRIEVTNKLIKEELNSNSKHGKMKSNDKAIVFIPNKENNDKSRKEFFEEYIQEVRQYYKGVIDQKTGKQIEVIQHILSSTYSDNTNAKNLAAFETAKETEPGVHILIVQDKGREGLHIAGGKIVYDLRGGETPNVALQKAGRIIYSLDPEKPLQEQNKTRFFDIKNSLYRQAVNNVGRKNSIQYDIYRIKQITNWINEKGRYPNINAGADSLEEVSDSKEQTLAEEEARIAYTLKRYQVLVKQYRIGYNIEPGQEEQVEEFLKLIDQIPKNDKTDFMDIQFGERTKEPLESDLIGQDFLNTSSEQERFIQLYEKAVQMESKGLPLNKGRIDKLMHILQVISTFKPNLQLPAGIITRESVYEWWNNGTKQREIESNYGNLSIDLRDFLKNNFNETEIKEIMVLLKSADTKQSSYHGEEYDFGRELALARGLFFTAEQKTTFTKKSPFEEYDISIIRSSGLIDFTRCPELDQDIRNMFGLKLTDYINMEDMCFKKEKDIPKWKRENNQRYNETDTRKRKPPYSNKKFGVLDKFSGISLVTGKKIMTMEEKETQERKEKLEEKRKELEREAEKRKEIERKKISEEKEKREKRKNRKNQEIRRNPLNYFKRDKTGSYVYHHELMYGSRKNPKRLYSFYEECDEQGFILEENEDTGNLEYHLLKDIEITRYVMTQMIDLGKSFN